MSEKNLPTEQPQAGQAPRLSSPHGDTGRAGHPEGASPEGPPAPVGLIWRIERRDTFEALRRGRRRRSGPISVSWIEGDPSEPPRVGYTIGRRVGPAVVRNRLRRRLRTVMREAAPGLRPGAYLLGIAPAAAHLSYAQLKAAVTEALKDFRLA